MAKRNGVNRNNEQAGDELEEQAEGAAPSLGLDEGPAEAEGGQAADRPARGRQGDDTRPYCPRHNCLLKAESTKETHTSYRCPVPGCETKEKRVRPAVRVPSNPKLCPQRQCRGEDGTKQVALEVDDRLSNLAQLHMVCPFCGFNMKVPRPQFDQAALERERRRGADDLAAR